MVMRSEKYGRRVLLEKEKMSKMKLRVSSMPFRQVAKW
jgi:hypothetical protein